MSETRASVETFAGSVQFEPEEFEGYDDAHMVMDEIKALSGDSKLRAAQELDLLVDSDLQIVVWHTDASGNKTVAVW